MASTFKAANTSFSIPSGGDVFIPKNPQGIAPTVYIRDGNNFYAYPLSQLVKPYNRGGNVYFTDSSGNEISVGNAGQVWEEAIKIFNQQTGLDYYNLTQQNIGDVEAAARSTGGVKSISSIDQYLQVQEQAQPGGDIDISQGQTFNQATGELISPTDEVIGSTAGATGQADQPAQAPEGNTIGASLNNQTGIANLPNLQPGDSGDNVKTLQAYLIGMGYPIADGITGYFGPQTQAALTQFQTANGIETAGNPGYFGPRTKTFLSSGVPPTSAPDTTQQPTSGTGTDTGGTSIPEGSDAGPVEPDPDVTYEEDISLDEILAASNLSDDQKEMIRQIYGTISTNDEQNAARIAQNIAQAMEFSNPYFKAQARIALDALTRGIAAQDTDLATREQQLSNTLNDLREDIAAGKDLLSFEEARDLREVERNYQSQLRDTRQNLAASGFTSSSRRARQEDILNETTGDIRESTTRAFGERRRGLNESLERGERDTAAEIERLSELAQRGKLKLFREAEQTVGSGNLPALPGLQPLGDISGSLQREQAKDALSYAGNSFAF